MFSRFRAVLFGTALSLMAPFGYAVAQSPNTTPAPVQSPRPNATKATPTPTPPPLAARKFDPRNLTAEQIVETVIVSYGYPVGRALLNQIRKTTLERGRASVTNTEGKVESVPYERYVIRGDNLYKERVRLDQEFPSARYSLVKADERIFGIYNNSVFQPRADAAKAFDNQIVHGLEALLRYKENESKIDAQQREKIMGVDYYIIDVTDKQERKTRFYISAKTFRVMMLTYEEDGVRYRRKFYDYNYAQGTLVPFRTVLWAGDKMIEEVDVGTITFGQKVDEELFKAG